MNKVARQVAKFAVVTCAMAPLAGCATILGGGSSQSVSLASEPAGARFIVKSSSGLQAAAGNAPQGIRLARKNEYQVEFTAPGFQPQTVALAKGINGWIWGNLIVGWILGFGIDFILGSAYKLEPSVVTVTMAKALDDAGIVQTFGVVRQLDERGKLLREDRVQLVPAAVSK